MNPHDFSTGRSCRFPFSVWFLLAAWSVLAAHPQVAEAQYPWNPATNKIVVLVINAHPDDEGIFFGGILPYYSAGLQLPTMILSMTSGDWHPTDLTVREAELRCAAWTYGVRYEPLFPRFRDVPSQYLAPNPYTNKIDATWDYWADGVLQGDGRDVEAGKLKAINYVAEQIRRYRPEVIITHDLNGEYGHDNHRATAIAVTNAFFVAADPGATATNLIGLPPWQAKKLYLHLYGTNRLFHRFLEEPLAELGNRSCRQVAEAGLACQVSQGPPDVSTVYRTGENFDAYPSEWWGLYASTVGSDSVLTNNLLAHGYTVPAGWSAGNFLENLGFTNTANHPPAFVSDPLILSPALKGGAYTEQDLAGLTTDPDFVWGETLIFQKLSGPAWLQVDATGGLSGTPAQGDLGTNHFLVRATDSGGLYAQTTVIIEVWEKFPTFVLNPITVDGGIAGSAFRGQSLGGKAIDPPASNTLTYSKLAGPSWLKVASAGRLSGMPLTADAGLNSFTVGVSDPTGGTDTANLLIQVVPGRAPAFKEIASMADHSIRITVTGAPSQTYIVQASTNLAAENWQPIATNSSGTNWFEMYETQVEVISQRYYRALVP